MHNTRAILLAALLVTLGVTACRTVPSTNSAGRDPEVTAGTDVINVSLRVTNASSGGVSIYAYYSGRQNRIGMVGAGATAQFPVTPLMVHAGSVTLGAKADPNGRWNAVEVAVKDGQVIDYHIAENIVLSRATVQ